MAADLTKVSPELKKLVEKLVANCKERGIEMRPSDGLRHPVDQAKLWRQSRSIEEIKAKIEEFKAGGAPFLAQCIEKAGPQSGGEVTKVPPGYSWHQWGEAVDCFWVVNGKAEWSTTKKVNGLNGYQVYAEEAKKLGLDAGGLWKSFKDWPHVQLRAAANPSKLYSMKQINDEMKKRFG